MPALRPAFLLGLCLLLAGSGCRRKSARSITLAGSTSVQPFAELLAEEYMKHHPDLEVNVQGGGSSAGIKAVTNHICNVGMSSRALAESERDLTQTVLAHDAIVLIVNARNPVARLTLEQAREAFAGAVTNWRDLGGPDMAITVVTREDGSGTRASFEEAVMTPRPGPDGHKLEPVPFARDALVQDSNGAVREIIASDEAAIGYISFGLVDERVRALVLDGVAPTVQTIRSGRYPVVRNFLLLTSGPPDSCSAQFLKYVLSPSAQELLASEGLIPVE